MFNIYLISSETNGKKIYKIGYTRRSVEERIKEFKTGNVSEFKIENVFHSKWGTKIESKMHQTFKNKKIKGEWFDLDESDINSWYDTCKLYHDNFQIIESTNLYYLDRGKF